MEQFLGFFLVFVVGCAGFLLFRKLKVPSPALLGAMFATGMLNIAGYFPQFSAVPLSFAANSLIGVMLGKEIGRNILRRIRDMSGPVLVQTAGMFLLSLLCGYTLYLMGGKKEISLITALLSGAAGGITEMVIFGLATNADVAVIALVQLFRVVIFLSLMPYMAMIGRKLRGGTPPALRGKQIRATHFAGRDYALMAVCAIVGAVFVRRLGIPCGELLGAMIFCGLYALVVDRQYRFDTKLRVFAQVSLGIVMGQRITPQAVEQLGDVLLPAVVVTLVMLVGCVLLALALSKGFGWDLTTCLLCTAPAGLSQVTSCADEAGVDPFTATVFHAVRLLSIVFVYPLIILLLL